MFKIDLTAKLVRILARILANIRTNFAVRSIIQILKTAKQATYVQQNLEHQFSDKKLSTGGIIHV